MIKLLSCNIGFVYNAPDYKWCLMHLESGPLKSRWCIDTPTTCETQQKTLFITTIPKMNFPVAVTSTFVPSLLPPAEP